MIYVLYGKFNGGLTFENFSRNKKISWIQTSSNMVNLAVGLLLRISHIIRKFLGSSSLPVPLARTSYILYK